MRKSNYYNWIQVFLSLITIIATILFVYYNIFKKERESDLLKKQSYLLDRQIIEYTMKLDSLQEYNRQLNLRLNSIVSSASSDGTPNLRVEEKYLKLEKDIHSITNQISKFENQNLALRQAINPINPEEVLTIARLSDEVKDIRDDFNSLKLNIDTKQNEFRDYILREKETSNKATNLILVVLIPLVLNFLYTVWKDLRKNKESENGST